MNEVRKRIRIVFVLLVILAFALVVWAVVVAVPQTEPEDVYLPVRWKPVVEEPSAQSIGFPDATTLLWGVSLVREGPEKPIE